MAVLHRLRRASSDGGVSRRRARRLMGQLSARAARLLGAALVVIPVASASACRDREEPNLAPPDSLLQDSLGLTPEDRVHRVVLTSTNGSELVDPREVAVEAGHFVEFFTQDGRVRTVSFVSDSLSPAQSSFLRSTGQDRSPPLVERETRFVVSFQDAPPGRYPFVVEGNERAITGAVIVAGPQPEG